MQRDQAHRTNELLERIAKALEVGNVTKAKEISGENTRELTAKAILDSVKVITDDYASKHPVDKLQGGKDIPLTITNDIPGFEGTKDALDNLTSDFHNYLGTSNKELHELKLHTDEGQSCDDDIVHNDYLTDLVQEMNKEQYVEFCQEMSYVNYDLKVVQHSIDELEYKECLGAIKQALAIIGDDADDPNLEVQLNQDDEPELDGAGFDSEGVNHYQEKLNQDEYTYEHDEPGNEYSPLIEYHCGVVNDSDFNLRKTAKMYTEELASGDFKTKKDCILDYVTNEFGSHGARYTDIIKFAYYLGSYNTFKYTNANRGYYSCSFSSRMNGHLIQGGKDQLVKGINKEGDERYFALSFVESVTDYWKRIS